MRPETRNIAATTPATLRPVRRHPALAAAAGLAALVALSPAARAETDAAPVKDGVAQVAITLLGDEGGRCVLDHASAPAGPVTFSVTNRSAPGLVELELLGDDRILGEKENLAPGLPTVAFTVTLGGGGYAIYCPGAAQEMQAFTVTGAAAATATSDTAALLAEGAAGYAHYVDGIVDAMATAVGRLRADIDAGDLAAARRDYALARPFYERIESDVDGFVLDGHALTDNAGNLDYLVDMRASNLDPAVGWHGFHAIERDLFESGAITASTKALGVELERNVELLRTRVKTLAYKPEDLANGAASLLEEVQTNKVSGEEESYSHIDLVDFAGNVEGAEQAFAFLEPGLERIDPDLAARVKAAFAAVKTALAAYRDPQTPGGYATYTAALRDAEAPKLSRTIAALQEPLARIAEKVATAN
ncbi:iron uptake system protein EfeO [Prosthecomicrobium pneumaticum]|uniref:Iron uptake system component EfeO n=1 Tax=Prosthecomicrobium pneumaticum TaxID=81895 RepID=A0A7W9FLY8_9HYPH|nr:iron uptake system protein EfeO [Prosthecomicrobium pneumaticum]MBB5753056.1 iron uptake system component EfeO [Prosthecomicrobium pneumaticum]